MKRIHPRLSFLSIAVISSLAHAENNSLDDEDKAIVLPTIVLSAQEKNYITASSENVTGMNLQLKKTPQSVTVMNASQIEQQSLQNLSEIMEYMPGVSTESSGSLYGGYQTMYSRGSEIHNYTVDGLPVSGNSFSGGETSGLGNMSSAAYNDVTLVRGATGLMNGIGDPSGMIALNRKRPLEDPHLLVKGQIGNDRQYNLQIDGSSPLNQENSIRGRGVLHVNNGDSFVDRGKYRNFNAYGVLDFDLSDATVLGVGAEYQKTTSDGLAMHSFAIEDSEGQPTQFHRKSNAATDWTNYQTERLNFFADLTHKFANDWIGKVQYSYTDSSSDQIYGVLTQKIEAGTNHTRLNAGFREDESRQHAFATNLQGQFYMGAKAHDFVLGFNHYNLKTTGQGMLSHTYDFGNVYDFNGYFPKPNWQEYDDGYSDYAALYYPNRDIKIQQSGLYGATRLTLTEPLSLIVGLRGTRYENTEKTVYLDGYTEETAIKDHHVITPYVGLTYDINPHLTAYSSFTNIFNPQYFKDTGGHTLPAEKGENYELGMKTSWFDNQLAVNLALFHIRKENMAIETSEFTPNGDYAYAVGQGEGTGFEFEAHGVIRPEWKIHTGFTQIALKDQGEKIRPNIPEQQFKLFSTYRLPFVDRSLTVGGGFRWQSKTYKRYGINSDANTQKAYAVVDLTAQYQLQDNWSVGLNVNNVFDKSYRVNPSIHSYGSPRHVLLSMQYRFK